MDKELNNLNITKKTKGKTIPKSEKKFP